MVRNSKSITDLEDFPTIFMSSDTVGVSKIKFSWPHPDISNVRTVQGSISTMSTETLEWNSYRQETKDKTIEELLLFLVLVN